MNNNNLVEKAIFIAMEYHRGQTYDSVNGPEPYFNHLDRVATNVKGLCVPTEEILATAYLHDTLEDTDYTWADLNKDFDSKIADNVMWLTRLKSETYEIYINDVIYRPIPRIVKIADLMDNIAHSIGARKISLLKRYLPVYHKLIEVEVACQIAIDK